MSLAHSIQGERVLYNVAPSELIVPFASLHNALASACITSFFVDLKTFLDLKHVYILNMFLDRTIFKI